MYNVAEDEWTLYYVRTRLSSLLGLMSLMINMLWYLREILCGDMHMLAIVVVRIYLIIIAGNLCRVLEQDNNFCVQPFETS